MKRVLPAVAVVLAGLASAPAAEAGTLCGLPLLPKCPATAPPPSPAPAPGPSAQAPGPGDPNPLVGLRWWVDEQWGPAAIDHGRLVAAGRTREAALMRKIAVQPQFKWYGRWAGTSSPEAQLRKDLARFERQSPGTVPQLVAMRHEGRECHARYQGGGAAEDARYRTWIEGFAGAIGDRRVVVAFEPDSLGTLECLAKGRRRARLRTLAYGVDVLSRLPNATVYLDAGASDWQGVSRMAPKLRAIGVRKVRGFMLNATHMDSTRANVRYGMKLSRALGGKHFIVNTSHNGNGPLHRKVWISRARNLWRIKNVWCNPPNSALGAAPTTRTGTRKVDAYLWVERPGYSNGACYGGPLPVGSWWRERALVLAARARW